MAKILTSALGFVLLNPIACGGVSPTVDAGSGGSSSTGGNISTGGSTFRARCSIMSTVTPCATDEICHQVMFPVMPPNGFGGNMGNDLLGECVPMGTGGASSTGGSQSTGGASSTLNTANVGGKTTKPPVTSSAGNTGGTLGFGGAPSAGGTASAAGSSSRTPCDVTTGSPCTATEVCTQVMFPIVAPRGLGGGHSYMFGECFPAGQSLNTSEPKPSSASEDDWWQTAEAALRNT